jgi:hypothetical protein
MQQAGVGGQLAARAATEQPRQRLAGALAEQIPQRDLDPGEGIDEWPVAAEHMCAMQHGAGQAVDVTSVAPDHQRRDDAVERRPGRRNCGVTKGFTPADQSVFGLDLHHQNIEMIPGLPGQQGMRFHIEGKRDHEAFDCGDRHSATTGESIPSI